MRKIIMTAVLVGSISLYSCGGKESKGNEGNQQEVVTEDVVAVVEDKEGEVAELVEETKTEVVNEVEEAKTEAVNEVKDAKTELVNEVKDKKNEVSDLVEKKKEELSDALNKTIKTTQESAKKWIEKVESLGGVVSKKHAKDVAEVKEKLATLESKKEEYKNATEDKKAGIATKISEISKSIQEKITNFKGLLK